MKILVATDGSRAGTAALRFASKLAGNASAGELIVLSVYARSSRASAESPAAREKARSVLADAARLAPSESPKARFELALARDAEDIPETILRQAQRLRVDLVVVGSEGRDSLAEWVVGGTALRLIYLARRPITVVRAPRRRPAKRSAA